MVRWHMCQGNEAMVRMAIGRASREIRLNSFEMRPALPGHVACLNREMRACVVLGVLGLLAAVRPAGACQTVYEYSAPQTLPAQGQQSVPTDVAILVDLSPLVLDVTDPVAGICTLRTLDGAEVPSTTERVAAWHAEVRPAAPLASDTPYELVIRGLARDGSNVTETVRFTTGTGPLEAELTAPVALIEHWAMSADVVLDSCDHSSEGTCVAVPTGEFVEATFIKDGLNGAGPAYLYDGPFESNLTGAGSFDCVRLRRRAMNGTYGDPTVLCGEDAGTVNLSTAEVSCRTDGVHGKITQEPACAMTPGSSPRASIAVLAALSLLRLRRRRPARSIP
jgi:hypothetical protein